MEQLHFTPLEKAELLAAIQRDHAKVRELMASGHSVIDAARWVLCTPLPAQPQEMRFWSLMDLARVCRENGILIAGRAPLTWDDDTEVSR